MSSLSLCQQAQVSAYEQALATVAWTLSGTSIEQESFRRIEAECQALMQSMPLEQWRLVRRLIHTSADVRLGNELVFRHDPFSAAKRALAQGCPIYCDAQMIKAGLSRDKLAKIHPSYSQETQYHCYISDAKIKEQAKLSQRTRALCALEYAYTQHTLDDALVLIGNAPLALARLARYIMEEGLRPSLVIAMPVGFVNVLEAKELISLCPVPQIVLQGRRGGSPLAVATVHALIENILAAN